MTQLLVLSEAEVTELLDLDALLGALAAAFEAYSARTASVPPRIGATTDDGLLAVMPVHLPDVALATKLVSVYPGNDARGRPSHQALITLFEADTGTPVAVMGGTRITAVRTGAAAAVAARALARTDATVLAILGAGVQGHSHLDAFPQVRDFDEIRVASRTAAHARELAERHPAAAAVDTFETAVRDAGVVCCCTDAREPIVQRDWLAPGAHVSSVGGVFGPELDEATVRGARVFVEWRGAVSNAPPTGAHELQGLQPDDVTEVGEVLAGTRPGRMSADELTVYKSTGLAVQDAAAAHLVYQAALSTGAGVRVAL